METFYACLIVIGLLGGSLVYVILENYVREKRERKRLFEYEQELTVKLIQLIDKYDGIVNHQYVHTGESYREALDRISKQTDPIEKEIHDTHKKLTDVLIEKI